MLDSESVITSSNGHTAGGAKSWPLQRYERWDWIIIYIKGDNEQTFGQAVLEGIRDVALTRTDGSSCENNKKNGSFEAVWPPHLCEPAKSLWKVVVSVKLLVLDS